MQDRLWPWERVALERKRAARWRLAILGISICVALGTALVITYH